MTKNHTDLFVHYYRSRFWANASGSSGPNSALEFTSVLRRNLQALFTQLQLNSILDLACGDANLFRHLDLGSTAYHGMDCVPELIEQNRRYFENSPQHTFECADVLTVQLPDRELILCRDLVHYLPNALVFSLLANILKTRARYLLITHNTQAPKSANTQTALGIFRPVNLTQAPFNLPKPLCIIDEDTQAKHLALWALCDLKS